MCALHELRPGYQSDEILENKTSPPQGEIKAPPFGVKPEILYKEQRLADLSRAINNYIQEGFFGGNHAIQIQIWCRELIKRLEEFK